LGGKIDPAALTGSWLHSHEEDDGGRNVFRSAGYDFPPARGRDGFELDANGDARRTEPGPDDRKQSTGGTWKLVDDELRLDTGGRDERYAVESVEPGKIVLRQVV